MNSRKTKSPALSTKQGRGKRNTKRLNNNSSFSQRQRLLSWLNVKSITTIEARQELNILMPAARICELKHKFGHNIISTWASDHTREGYCHRVARYTLVISSDKKGEERK